MSLALFKLLVTVITGTAGVGGVTAPFAYTEATRSSYQTKWKKIINADPVISCVESSFKYDFELTTDGQEGTDFSIAVSKEEEQQFTAFGGAKVNWHEQLKIIEEN